MKTLILTIFLFNALFFSPQFSREEKVCLELKSKNYEGVRSLVNEYFQGRPLKFVSQNQYDYFLNQADTLASFLKTIKCIDSCYKLGNILESKPPMTDVIMVEKETKKRYLIRLIFKTPIQCVLIKPE